MKPLSKTSRGPPAATCVIKGEPHYNVAGAARMIEVISESTLRRWVINGWTSFGLSLDIVRRKGRLYIPELKVIVLKELFEETPLPKPGASPNVRDAFRQSVKNSIYDRIRPRSPYSRARNPRPRLDPP